MKMEVLGGLSKFVTGFLDLLNDRPLIQNGVLFRHDGYEMPLTHSSEDVELWRGEKVQDRLKGREGACQTHSLAD